MVDIHAHIIPFVDDGSKSLEDSVRLIEEEIKQGVTEIICTPHFDLKRYFTPVNVIEEQFNLLNAKVKELNLNVKLFLGQEICYTWKVNIIEKLQNHELLTLKNSKYVLIEFDFYEEPINFLEFIYNIRIKGFRPIIAHVERYEWLNEKKLQKIIIEGGLIQVNANSLIDCKSRKLQKRARSYVKKGYVNYIASDIHVVRKNTMAEAYKKFGKYLNIFEF